METVFIYIPTRLLPTSSKQQQMAFSIYWKFSTLPILFFISKNLLRALKQTKTCSKPPIIQIGLLWPLGFYQKTKNAETASNKTLYMLKIELDSLDNLKK